MKLWSKKRITWGWKETPNLRGLPGTELSYDSTVKSHWPLTSLHFTRDGEGPTASLRIAQSLHLHREDPSPGKSPLNALWKEYGCLQRLPALKPASNVEEVDSNYISGIFREFTIT